MQMDRNCYSPSISDHVVIDLDSLRCKEKEKISRPLSSSGSVNSICSDGSGRCVGGGGGANYIEHHVSKKDTLAVLKLSVRIKKISGLVTDLQCLLCRYHYLEDTHHHLLSQIVLPLQVVNTANLMEKAKSKGVSLLLPTDLVIADKFAADANSEMDGWMDGWGWILVLILSRHSVILFDTTETVIFNGPMGVFEIEKFATGTMANAKKLAQLSGKGLNTIIGGGVFVVAVAK